MSFRVQIPEPVEAALRRFALEDAIAVRNYLKLVAELANGCAPSDPIWSQIDRADDGSFRWAQRKTEVHFELDPSARTVNVLRVLACSKPNALSPRRRPRDVA